MRRFDSAIKSIANIENVVSLDLLLMILMKGSFKNNSSLVASLATIGNLFIDKIRKWPQNDVIHFGCFNVLHKILSVIHVIRGFIGHRIHF